MKISVLDTASPKLAKLIEKISDLSVPFAQSATLIRKHAEENFDLQGFYFGGWPPLAPSTKKQRARLGYGPSRPILVRTGRLRDGFEIRDKRKDIVKVGNYVPYAVYHDSDEPRSRLPQRKILMVDQKAAEAIKRVFTNYFKEMVRTL